MPKQQKCPVSGCILPVVEDVVPVCRRHAIEIWRQVQLTLPACESAHEREARQLAEEARLAGVRQEKGWVYFLTLDEKVKVGWTSNLRQRLRSYPPHAQMVVHYPATRADERDMHRSLKNSRVAGREWYEPTPEVVAAMRNAQLGEDIRLQAERAAWEAAHPPAPPPQPARRAKPRPLRGGALVRAIIAGEVE